MARALTLLVLAACASPVAAPLPPAAPEPPPAPAGSDLRPQFAAFGLPPRAQGHRPTCSIFTTVAAIEFAAARATGTGERFSVDYLNWAGNVATGRADDGDFFHTALDGWERFGICADTLLPYGAAFDPAAVPPPDALVDGGRHRALLGQRLRVRWLKPNDGVKGLTDAQFADVIDSLVAGWPVAAGSGHSRLLVGYDASGDGRFLTLDSGSGRFDEVSAAYVRGELYDVFVVTAQ